MNGGIRWSGLAELPGNIVTWGSMTDDRCPMTVGNRKDLALLCHRSSVTGFRLAVVGHPFSVVG